MVLLAASICTKSGKALVSRQFMEMTRTRIEGLLAAFPKLISTEKNQAQRQHTFVETESVRYVYQPMDNLCMVLITTRNSNILEDLETLRLFSRVIPEYCRANEEKDILEHAFELIFAFDEIVALGYRESVNLAQIRTFTEMDSHEERVFNQIKIAQERAANETMVQRAKELKLARNEKLKTNRHGWSWWDQQFDDADNGDERTDFQAGQPTTNDDSYNWRIDRQGDEAGCENCGRGSVHSAIEKRRSTCNRTEEQTVRHGQQHTGSQFPVDGETTRAHSIGGETDDDGDSRRWCAEF